MNYDHLIIYMNVSAVPLADSLLLKIIISDLMLGYDQSQFKYLLLLHYNCKLFSHQYYMQKIIQYNRYSDGELTFTSYNEL